MKIQVWLPDLSGGGAERVAIRLANGFARDGHSVKLLLLANRGPLAHLVDSAVTVESMNVAAAVRAIPRYARVLRRDKPDVVLANLTHVNLASTFARIAAGWGGRLVLIEHNTLTVERARSARRFERAWPLVARLMYPSAHAIVGVSEGVVEDLRRNVGVQVAKLRRIYNPILDEAALSFGALAAEARVNTVEPRERLRYCWVGRFVQQKRPDLAIRAFQRVRQAADAELFLAGDGPLRAECEALVRTLGLVESVKFLGFVANPSSIMARCDVLILSSDYEGFGNVLVEALNVGCRVVATDCPFGPSEILTGRQGARLSPTGDADALADAALAVLLDDISPSELRSDLQEFHDSVVVKSYLKLFTRAAS